ncbi:TlpA family protein disulfide reductase [bacterium]|nr:TlpA family protein disulfide reductase [bacterium]
MKKQIILSLISLTLVLMACGSEQVEEKKKAQKSTIPTDKRLLSTDSVTNANKQRMSTASTLKLAKKSTIEKRSSSDLVRMQKTIKKGENARLFKGETWDGQEISMEKYKGKYVLLDFWATWCPPCKKEIPHLRELAKKYAGNEKFGMIGISLDRNEKPLVDYVKKNKMTWPNIYDAKNGNIAALYGVKTIPFTVLIDPDGKVIATKIRGKAMLKEIAGRLGT